MKLHVSGKLRTTAEKQPSFEDFLIEALFEQKPAPISSRFIKRRTDS